MASTLTVHCDRCGATVLADRTLIRVETGPLRVQLEHIDLCGDCAPLLACWLREPEVTDVIRPVTTEGA